MLRLRPTFEIAVRCSRDEVITKLEEAAKLQGQHDLFRMHGEYGELHLPIEEHRVWSPHLSFYVTERNDQVLILGRFAPRVDVWTTIWIFYLLMAFTAFFGFTLAYSQWALGHSTWGIWIGVVPVILIALLHVVASIGQTWSDDQMQSLKAQLEETVRKLDC
ncbi:MAG: hypothetical protein Aurels2KO_14140 [Aureliella sp.]